MKVVVLAAILFFSSAVLFAQDIYSIKGAAVDTMSFVKLPNTTISVLNSKDSTLVRFTRAISDGSFTINKLQKGKFILLITYPGYADYVDTFSLDSVRTSIDFGKINMVLKSNLLASVIIKGAVTAIKIKGDTTEFNAAAFKIQPNAKVEDLLKQLPGIQIDKDGKITAQGETVNKVLVDGEEFFGDDPTLVTKNLRGDMVDKVQLYDKKSDQAAFTGIDDGVKTKTINIQLKEDKKNGYFGKVDAGGSPEYHQEQLMINAFKSKRKASAYGTIGNTGKTGLNWEDSNKYGSSTVEISDGGGIMINSGGGEDIRYNGQGIPQAGTGGAHYDSKWNKDKESINTNYKIGSIVIDGTRNNLTQNNLPNIILNSNEDQVFSSSNFRQKLDATYQVKLDSTSNLKVSIDGTVRNTTSNTKYSSRSLRGSSSLQTLGDRQLSNDGYLKSLNASAFYSKKFKKDGRTISLNISKSNTVNGGKGYLNSYNTFYNKEADLDITMNIDSVQHIDQYKTTENSSSLFNTNLTYSEPFTKEFSVILNYGLNLNNSTSDRKSFNQSAPGRYDLLDEIYSNDFELRQISNQGGAIFNYKNNKTLINFGTRVSAIKFEQFDVVNSKSYNRKFINLSPQAQYLYRFSQQKSIRLGYNGSTSQPGIEAIQPIRINTDPLNITIGNANLKPSFRNNFNGSFNSYKVLSSQSIYLSGSFSFTSNAIVSNRATDSAGKSTFQSVNLTNKTPVGYYVYGYFDRKIQALGFNVGLNFDISGNTSYSYINNQLNTTTFNSYTGGLSFSKYQEKKFEFRLSAGPSYTTGESSIQKLVNNNGLGFRSEGVFSVFLPGKVRITSDANYEYKEKTLSFNQNFNRLIWNSSLSKRFFKKENLGLVLSGNDLLNQNVGFNRNANGNMITQNSYTTIKRFFLFSLIWEFNKMGGGVNSSTK